MKSQTYIGPRLPAIEPAACELGHTTWGNTRDEYAKGNEDV